MVERSVNRWKMAAIVLAVAFAVYITFVLIGQYNEASEQEKSSIFQQGALYGYQGAVEQLMQNAANCSAVSVYSQNKTMQLVDVSCLSSAGSA